MSKYFDKAFELCKQEIMPDDIIDQLDELKLKADQDELHKFSWLYEAAHLQVDQITET